MPRPPASIDTTAPRYVCKSFLARRYDISPRTVDRWLQARKDGFPMPLWIAGRPRWPLDSIEQWERSLAAQQREVA